MVSAGRALQNAPGNPGEAMGEGGMTQSDDARPPVAVGHVRMDVNDLHSACDLLERLGLRPVNRHDTFAVLELRGGTHLIVRAGEHEIEPGRMAPIDLMVDDVAETHARYRGMGLDPSEITSGSIHSSFTIPFTDGYRLKITSSHTSGRPV